MSDDGPPGLAEFLERERAIIYYDRFEKGFNVNEQTTRKLRMIAIVSQWEDIRGRGERGVIRAEGTTMVAMLDELRDLIRAEQDNEEESK